ncbi:MAG: fumarylacetoacetate hydrolase family protein, partial [Bacteroidota bacterium]
YYGEVALGIDFTARDLQREAQAKGTPWEKAKGFDRSAPISSFFPISDFTDVKNLNFSLKKNGELMQQGNSADMIFSIDRIIAHVSQFITLKMGDIIFTGTPAGVGPVQIGDKLEGFIEDKKVLSCNIR